MITFPSLTGYKTKIAGYTQIIGGVLYALAEFLKLATDCLNGIVPLDACIQHIPTAAIAVAIAANGLGQLGIGHKIERLK
jgi:hypothetical protein